MATTVPAKHDATEKHVGIDTPEYDSDNVVHAQTHERESFWTRMGCSPNSFKRQRSGVEGLNKTMKPRHLHMIAIGGSIGAGFFVGSGSALRKGGPGAVLIDFMIMGAMIFNVVYALGELAVMYPVSGGFYTYSTRFISPSWGFAMGWNYVMQWGAVLPFELVVAAMTVQYWRQDVSPAIWVTLFLVLIIVINIFGVLGFAEEEFWSSVLKLAAIISFMLIAFILVLGGGPDNGKYNEYWGARLWYDPGAFKNGFKGVCSVFVTAAFAFSGTEIVGLAAAESENPAKALPGAIKQVFWRITLFYVVGLLFVGLLVSSNDKRLLGNVDFVDAAASPFVIAAKDAGLKGYDSFINVVICVSVFSIGNAGVYGGSRTLAALAEQGYAPRGFSYIDRAGRPLFSTIFLLLCGFLAYLVMAANATTIFDWLLALSGLAALFTWGSILVAHIRFRHAWAKQGHTKEEIPFRAMFGIAGSYVSLLIIILVLIAQFYTALSPIGVYEDFGGPIGDANTFFISYLAAPVVLFFWVCGYIWKRGSLFIKSGDIDLNTGRREVDWDAIHAEKARVAAFPAWKRVLYFLF